MTRVVVVHEDSVEYPDGDDAPRPWVEPYPGCEVDIDSLPLGKESVMDANKEPQVTAGEAIYAIVTSFMIAGYFLVVVKGVGSAITLISRHFGR